MNAIEALEFAVAPFFEDSKEVDAHVHRLLELVCKLHARVCSVARRSHREAILREMPDESLENAVNRATYGDQWELFGDRMVQVDRRNCCMANHTFGNHVPTSMYCFKGYHIWVCLECIPFVGQAVDIPRQILVPLLKHQRSLRPNNRAAIETTDAEASVLP